MRETKKPKIMDKHTTQKLDIEEVLAAIRKQYKKDFGELYDEGKDRDGYFILGFVKEALENYTQNDENDKRRAGFKNET